jgi:hypothetical protein
MRAAVDEQLAFDERRQVLLSMRAICGEIAYRLDAFQQSVARTHIAYCP